MNKPTSTRLGQILLEKGLVTAEQLDIAVKEQQKRRQLLDPFDANLGVNSSLGEILIELGFIDRLQLKRGLNWQLMMRKMAIVMSFCAPLMTVSYGAAAATRPTFTVNASSSVAPKVTPSFTKTSSSVSSVPAIVIEDEPEDTFSSVEDLEPEIVAEESSSASSTDFIPEEEPESSSSSSAVSKPEVEPKPSSVAATSSRASSVKSSASSSSKNSSVVSSIRPSSSSSKSALSSSKSSVASSKSSSKSSAASSKASVDTIAPSMPEKITVVSVLSDRVYLSWISASDNLGVVRYKIFRDQVQIDTVDGAENSYMDFNVAPGKTYLYGISAGDESGNWSVVKSFFVQTPAIQQSSRAQVSSTAFSSVASIGASSKSASLAPASSSSVSSNAVTSSSAPSMSSTSSKVASSVASSNSSKALSSTASSNSSKALSSLSSVASTSSNSSKALSSVTSSSSSKAVSSATSSSSSKAVSSVASSSSSKAVSSVSSAGSENVSNIVFKSWVVAGPVSFTWTAPDSRENGNELNITEIGGYELRYRKTTDHSYTYITINDAWKNYYNFTWLDGTYIFEIAAFDKNGLYSTFVDLTPH